MLPHGEIHRIETCVLWFADTGNLGEGKPSKCAGRNLKGFTCKMCGMTMRHTSLPRAKTRHVSGRRTSQGALFLFYRTFQILCLDTSSE